MASVGESVRKAIDDWELGEPDFAMLHACNAVDGTASKTFPALKGSNARFTRLLRDNYEVVGAMGMPGIDLVTTRWPVKVANPKASGFGPDLADVIYGIHRCTHGHGDELPLGFELIADSATFDQRTRAHIERGRIQLSDRMIFALLAVAVFSPVNVGQLVPDGYHLTYGTSTLEINDWWGRIADASVLFASVERPSVRMDFTDWMTVAK